IRFAQFFRIIPAVNGIGLYSKMYIIIPGDIVYAGMGHNTNKPSSFFLPPDKVSDARVCSRDMCSDIFFPSKILFYQFLFGKIPPLPAHLGKTKTVAVLGKFFQCYGASWTEFL